MDQKRIEKWAALRSPEIQALKAENDRLLRKIDKLRAGGELIVEAVSQSLVDFPPVVTYPPKPRATGTGDEEIACVHITDVQYGKRTSTYSSSVADERIAMIGRKVEEVTLLRRHHARVRECRIYLGGDMVEGENIFPGQAHEIDQSLFSQALRGLPTALSKLVVHMLRVFDRVRVVGVRGNHGRPGRFGAGDHRQTNWDTVCYRTLELMILGPHAPASVRKRVSFSFSEDTFFQIDRVFEWGNLIVHGDQISGGFAGFPWYGCVPDDHTILTRTGWKKVDDLILGEDALTFDPQTHENRWEPVLDITTHNIRDDIYKMSRPGGREILFTRDHAWPVYDASGSRGMVKAFEIGTKHWLPVQGQFHGKESILSPRHAAILGWVVTDGHGRWTGNHWEAVVYQSERKHLALIENLLGSGRRPLAPSQIAVQEDVHAVPVARQDAIEITKHYRTKNDLPGIVGRLSREACDAMFEAMMQAEGSTRGQSSRFSQKQGPVSEAFLMLAALTGKTAWPTIENTGMVRSVPRVGKGSRPTWGDGLKLTRFEGRVWCPTTKTGTWWVRSPSGIIMPTGNSAKKAWGWIDTMPEPWDYMWTGHFHTPASMVLNKRELLAGGTTESDNEYAQEQLAAGGYPRQRLAYFNARYGLISDVPLYLDNSRKPNGRRKKR